MSAVCHTESAPTAHRRTGAQGRNSFDDSLGTAKVLCPTENHHTFSEALMQRRRKPSDPDATASTPAPKRYRDAEAFLRAVALGDEPATLAQRIRAAGMLIRAGAPVSNLPPRERAKRDRLIADAEAKQEWERVASAIRAKHGRPN
jgi:hypothetical protein